MQAWLSDLTRPIGNIIHIGAGAGSNLAAYLEAGAQAIVLVDPSADEVAELETQVAARAGVSVIEAAVSADGEMRPFRRTNFPELDSFRAPTGLVDLFPGLRILSEEPVRPMEPARVFDGLALDGEGSNLLILETPGESLGILQALRAAGLLRAFDMLRLRDGREQLYAGAATMAEIGGYLAQNGFSVDFESEPEDPERPYLLARQDRVQLALEEMRAALALSEAARRDFAGQNDVLRQQIEALTAERDQAQAAGTARQAELEQARQQSQARAQKIEALTAERDQAQAEAAQLGEKIVNLPSVRDEIVKAEGQITLIRDLFLRGEKL